MTRCLLAWLTACVLALSPLVVRAYPGGSAVAGFPPPYTAQAETNSWVAQVVTNGGTVGTTQKYYVNAFIAALKGANSASFNFWALLDDAWLLDASGSVQTLTSLKGLRLATVTGGVTITPRGGTTFDGTTGFINTGWNPSTMASNFTSTNGAIGSYDLTNTNSNNVSTGVIGSGTLTTISIGPRFSNTFTRGNLLNSSSSNSVALSPATSVGYTVIARTSGPVFTIYKTGASLGTYSPSSGTTLPNQQLYIGCVNNNGTASTFRPGTTGFVDVRAAFSAGNEAVYYQIVRSYIRSMGGPTP